MSYSLSGPAGLFSWAFLMPYTKAMILISTGRLYYLEKHEKF